MSTATDVYLQITSPNMPFIANPLSSTVGYLDTFTVKCNDNVISYSFVNLDNICFVDASTDGTVVSQE